MSKKIAILSLFFSAFLWGTSFPVIRLGMVYVDFFSFLFYRNFFAIIGSAIIFVALNRKELRNQIKQIINPYVILLGAITALAMFFQFWSQSLTTAGENSLLVSTNIIWVALFSLLWFKERLTKRGVVGLACGIVGVYFLTIGFNFIFLFKDYTLFTLFGDIFGLIAGLSWAAYIVVGKKIVAPTSSERGRPVTPATLVFYSNLYVFMILLIPSLFTVRFIHLEFSPLLNIFILLYALYLGLICSSTAYIFYYRGLREISATVASVYLILEVLIAFLIEYIIFFQLPFIDTLIGGVLICLAVVLISVKEQDRIVNEDVLM